MLLFMQVNLWLAKKFANLKVGETSERTPDKTAAINNIIISVLNCKTSSTTFCHMSKSNKGLQTFDCIHRYPFPHMLKNASLNQYP